MQFDPVGRFPKRTFLVIATLRAFFFVRTTPSHFAHAQNGIKVFRTDGHRRHSQFETSTVPRKSEKKIRALRVSPVKDGGLLEVDVHVSYVSVRARNIYSRGTGLVCVAPTPRGTQCATTHSHPGRRRTHKSLCTRHDVLFRHVCIRRWASLRVAAGGSR